MDNIAKDNKVGVPFEHYRTLYAALNPVEAGYRNNVPFDTGKNVYTLKMLNRLVKLPHPELSPVYADSGEALSREAAILLARLILEGQLVPMSPGNFLAYAEMPWGNLYNDNFHGRCVLRLTFGFGRDLSKFARACETLGGIRADVGDIAFDVEFISGLFLRLIFWEGDDEFQPSAQILFSDNFPHAFMAEDMAVVGDILISEMKKVQ